MSMKETLDRYFRNYQIISQKLQKAEEYRDDNDVTYLKKALKVMEKNIVNAVKIITEHERRLG